MREYLNFYIDGKWVEPLRPNTSDVENPATEATTMDTRAEQTFGGSAGTPIYMSPEQLSHRPHIGEESIRTDDPLHL